MSGRSNKPLHQRLRLTKKNLRLRAKVDRDNREKFGSPRKGYITPAYDIFVPSAGWSPRTFIRNKVEKSIGDVGKKAHNLHHPTLKAKADRHVYGLNFTTTQNTKDELLRRHLAATKYSGKKWPKVLTTKAREEKESKETKETKETNQPTEPVIDNQFEDDVKGRCTNCTMQGGRKTKRRRKKLRRTKRRRKTRRTKRRVKKHRKRKTRKRKK